MINFKAKVKLFNNYSNKTKKYLQSNPHQQFLVRNKLLRTNMWFRVFANSKRRFLSFQR